jgi:O-antigen ligase
MLIVMLVATLTMPILKDRLKDRFHDDSSQHRIPLMKLALDIGVKNPILGIGINNYSFEMKKYLKESSLEVPWLAVVHNQYLLLWAETGIIGVIGYVFMVTSTLKKGIGALKGKTRFTVILCALVAAMIGHLVHSLFDSFRETWLIWGIMGIISGTYDQIKISNRNVNNIYMKLDIKKSTVMKPRLF